MLVEPLNIVKNLTTKTVLGKVDERNTKGMVEVGSEISFKFAALYCTLHTAPKSEHAPVPAHFILETEHSTHRTPYVYTACCSFNTSHSKHPRFA